MSDDTVLVCRRVADMPTPPVKSVEAVCGVCGAPIWVALSSPSVRRRWCTSCVAEEVEHEAEVGAVTKEQLADLAAHFNRRH
jgi:hypothetical protein